MKASASNAGDQGSIPGRKIPWRRKWQSTPVFLLGESHGRRSPVGYSPQGHKELDTTERLHLTLPYLTLQGIYVHFILFDCGQVWLTHIPKSDLKLFIHFAELDWNNKEHGARTQLLKNSYFQFSFIHWSNIYGYSPCDRVSTLRELTVLW